MSSNLVLRRYTPPTCTLEIATIGSPMSRWVGRSVLKQANFLLNFDDPRLPEDKQVTVRGDKAQLEALYQAVTAYVQEFLEQAPEKLNGWYAISELETATPSNFQTESAPDAVQNEEIHQNPQSYSTSTENPPAVKFAHSPGKICLQPNGLLSHDLFLGSLATEESGPAINLSLLQLFDLATALEEYKTESIALVYRQKPSSARQNPPYWAIATALVTVTIGVSAGILKLLERQNSSPTIVPANNSNPTINPNQNSNPTQQPQVAVVPAPIPAPTPAVIPTPPATSPQTLPSVPGLTANQTPLPTATPPLSTNTPGTPGVIPPVRTAPPANNSVTPPMGTYRVPANSPGGFPPGAYRIPSNSPSSAPSTSFQVPSNPRTPSSLRINRPMSAGTPSFQSNNKPATSTAPSFQTNNRPATYTAPSFQTNNRPATSTASYFQTNN